MINLKPGLLDSQQYRPHHNLGTRLLELYYLLLTQIKLQHRLVRF